MYVNSFLWKITVPFVKPVIDHFYFKASGTLFKVPFSIGPPHIWWHLVCTPGQRYGRFREREGYIPTGRWGGYFLGFEVGKR